MRVKAKYNTGKPLLNYPRHPFGVSEKTQYGLLEIGEEYLVMGMIIIDGCLYYIINSGSIIDTCPFQLFEVTDNSIPSSWFFKANSNESPDFAYCEAIWGYSELVFDDEHLGKLIEMDETAQRIYFRRKIALEDENGE